MDENRINNTDPIVQVRLCVVFGNLHGARKKVYLAVGFVYPRLGSAHERDWRFITDKGGYMQNSRERITNEVQETIVLLKDLGVPVVLVSLMLVCAAAYMAYRVLV